MKRLLSLGRRWSIRDFEADGVTPRTYRLRAETTPAGMTIVEADPLVPPERWEAVLEKVHERRAMREAP